MGREAGRGGGRKGLGTGRRGEAEMKILNFADYLDTPNLVVAFFSLARIFGECSTIHSPLALFF